MILIEYMKPFSMLLKQNWLQIMQMNLYFLKLLVNEKANSILILQCNTCINLNIYMRFWHVHASTKFLEDPIAFKKICLKF